MISKIREVPIKPIGMKIDHETGDILYKYKKGGEYVKKRHNDTKENSSVENEDIPY